MKRLKYYVHLFNTYMNVLYSSNYFLFILIFLLTAAETQWVIAFAPQAEGWVFESQPPIPKSLKQVETDSLSNSQQ